MSTDTDSPSPASDEQAAAAMHAELKALLDSVPASRRVLQHLAVMERVLKHDGLPGIGWLPLVPLEKARAQLRSLPFKPENVMLPQLLSLLTLAVESRNARQAPPGADQFLSSFLTDDKLLVSEASHTDFVDALGDVPP